MDAVDKVRRGVLGILGSRDANSQLHAEVGSRWLDSLTHKTWTVDVRVYPPDAATGAELIQQGESSQLSGGAGRIAQDRARASCRQTAPPAARSACICVVRRGTVNIADSRRRRGQKIRITMGRSQAGLASAPSSPKTGRRRWEAREAWRTSAAHRHFC